MYKRQGLYIAANFFLITSTFDASEQTAAPYSNADDTTERAAVSSQYWALAVLVYRQADRILAWVKKKR